VRNKAPFRKFTRIKVVDAEPSEVNGETIHDLVTRHGAVVAVASKVDMQLIELADKTTFNSIYWPGPGKGRVGAAGWLPWSDVETPFDSYAKSMGFTETERVTP
jgi:hypothetical protein